MRALPDPATLADAVAHGKRSAVAIALNLLDDRRPAARKLAARFLALLPQERLSESAHLIGITGPPGVGKSSLTSALITVWRAQGLRVGILAVDPSSPISGGALLGDRLRMIAGKDDDGVFIRSLACRGQFGGLSAEVWPMSLAMLAAFDIVLIETVGVGQKEVDISKMSDTTCFIAQPASGDSIQFLKAGIMEVPQILVVNKADMGTPARKTMTELQMALSRSQADTEWQVPVLSVSATQGLGIEELVAKLDQHRTWLAQHRLIQQRRQQFQAEWTLKRLREEFGAFGLRQLGGESCLLAYLIQDNNESWTHYDQLRIQLLDGWNH